MTIILDAVRSTREPHLIDGIPCYAPAIAHAGEDYPIEAYEQLYRKEECHFWFRSRNRIILWAIGRFVKQQHFPRLLEIGCGTGYVLQELAATKGYHLVGAEAHLAGLRYARQRLPSVDFVQLDARDLPYVSQFDGIGAFDVIEHIEEDEAVLRSAHRALMPRGVIVLTVPQHKWLWSAVDEYARHKRRYTRSELLSKLVAAGFEIVHCTSFVTMLLPALYAARVTKRAAGDAGSTSPELEIPSILNAVFGAAMRLDEAFIRAGVSLPAGGSLLVVARRI